MWYRWSDARIVPVKQLKDCGGKSRESCYPHSFGIRNNIKRETSSIYTKGQVQETANKENIKSLLNKEKLLKSTIIHDMI